MGAMDLIPPPGRDPTKPKITSTKGLKGLVPQNRTTNRLETRGIPTAVSVAFASVETELGGRQRIVDTLMQADLPTKLRRLLAGLVDPENHTSSLAVIATQAGVSLAQFQNAFIEARKIRGRMLATNIIMDRIPGVAKAVMEDAVPGQRECTRCLGARMVADRGVAPTAEVPNPVKPCPVCDGMGLIAFQPEHATQITALKISGLMSEGKGLTIVNQNLQRGGSPGSVDFDQLSDKLDGVLYGTGRGRMIKAPEATDAELVDSDSEG